MQDNIMFVMSQDYFKGDALYTVKIDGEQIGGLHSAARKVPLTVAGDWAPGKHTVEIKFMNDHWEGTPETDRNLYLDQAIYNGNDLGIEIDFYQAKAVSFDFNVIG